MADDWYNDSIEANQKLQRKSYECKKIVGVSVGLVAAGFGIYKLLSKNEYSFCDECGSEFLKSSSALMALCPECAHILYGYPNCLHVFKNGRCIYCYWDGQRSEYIKWLLSDD